MNVSIVSMPGMKALVLKTRRNGSDVRTAWAEVQRMIREKNVDWINRDIGYVFVPEWQWATGVEELWVGVEVESYTPEQEDVELFTLPSRTYAKIRVHGDREQLDKTYAYLNEWFDESGYERDDSRGSFSIEANRLKPTNPFDIPADEINHFDYEIYVPIKKTRGINDDRNH